MTSPATRRRRLLLAALLVAAILLGLLLWRVLPISCPSRPEWWMAGC